MSQKDNSVPQFSSFEIERQARIKRSVVIQALARGTMRAFAKWLRSLVLRSTKLTRRLAARRRTYSDIRELQRFDDRMLADIGIATNGRAQFDGQLPAVNAQVLSSASPRLSHFDLWATASICLAMARPTVAESATVVSPICAAAAIKLYESIPLPAVTSLKR